MDGKNKLHVILLLSIIFYSCNRLYPGLYYHSSPFGGEFIKINCDSTFLYYSTLPPISDRFGKGTYKINKSNIYFNSSLKEITELIQVTEKNKNYGLFSDSCYKILLTYKFERSYYKTPTQICIKAISKRDTLKFLPYSDSIQLMNCYDDSIWSGFYNNTWVDNNPSLKRIEKILIEFDDKQFVYSIRDNKQMIDIQIYDKKYDSLEYREFNNETWKITRKALVELNNKEQYRLLKSKYKKDAELIDNYKDYIDMLNRNN